MAIDWKKVKNWIKIAGVILGGVVMLFLARRAVKAIVAWISPAERRNWMGIPGDPKHIFIYDEMGNPIRVKLPDGVRAKDVKGAGISKDNILKVEIRHETVDRRNPGGSIADSAGSRLRGRQ